MTRNFGRRTRLHRAVVTMSAYGASAAGLGLLILGRFPSQALVTLIGVGSLAVGLWCLWQLWSDRVYPVAVMAVIASGAGILGAVTTSGFRLAVAAILVLYAAIGAVIIADTRRFWLFIFFVGATGGFHLLGFWLDWLPDLDRDQTWDLVIQGIVFWAAAWMFRKVRDEIVTQDEHLHSKDAFLARVGHELRTPLTSVLGYSALLAEDPRLPDDVRRDAAVISAEASHMAEVVDDFTVVARIDDHLLHLRPVMTALTPAIDSVLAGLSPNGVEVTVTGDGDAIVYADPLRLRQMLRTLIDNGLRHAHSRVEIAVREGEDATSIDIVDDGPGLSTVNLEEFLQPYHQAHAEPGQPQRLGLGLNVALQLAKAMNADLTYRRSGISVFRITFANAPQPPLMTGMPSRTGAVGRATSDPGSP